MNVQCLRFFGAMLLPKLENLFGLSRREKVDTGSQLLEESLLENQRLFITEDIDQLKSAFKNESQLVADTEAFETSGSSLHHILAVVFAVLVGNGYLFYDYDYLFSFILLLGIVTFGLLAFFFYKKHLKKQFCNTFVVITKELKKEKELYKELLHLIEDSCSFSEKERPENRIGSLKLTFRDNALQSFFQLRKCTKLLMDRFPLKADIDNNLICQLPDESFESYNNDDELNLKALKSLKQLVRLQISELLKRFLFLFAQNYFKADDDSVDLAYLQTVIFKQLLDNSHAHQKALLSVLYYQKSFYQQEAERIPHESSSSDFWPACRNIRKSLYSSLSILDELETKLKLKNQELSAEDVATVESNFDLLSSEISAIQNSSQNIIKSLKSKSAKSLEENESLHAAEATASNNVMVSTSNVAPVEEYVAKDEVFEAYIPQKIEENSNSAENYNEQETTPKDIISSSNVFHELKHALKDKAIEHQCREAKALGIQVDVGQLEKEYITTVIEKVDNQERKRVFASPARTEVNTTISSGISSGCNIALNLDIALMAREKMRLMISTQPNEDTFECDTPAQSDDSNHD